MADGSGFTGFERLRRSISGELFDDGLRAVAMQPMRRFIK